MSDSKIELDELIINSRPLKRVGAPVGNKNAQKTKNKDDSVKVKKKKTKATSGGNSREYWIRRLKRDAPEHLELLEKGAYKTVAEAARKAGLKKKPSFGLKQFFKKVELMGISDLEHIAYLAESKFSALEQESIQYRVAKALHEKFSREAINVLYVLKHIKHDRPKHFKGDKLLLYTSLRKKFYNFGRKFNFEIFRSIRNRNYKIRKGLELYDIVNIYYSHLTGGYMHSEYKYFLKQFSLPYIDKIIFPIRHKNTCEKSIDPKNLKCLEFTFNRMPINIERLFRDAIQPVILDDQGINDCIVRVDFHSELYEEMLRP